jgi:hypothetical protein
VQVASVVILKDPSDPSRLRPYCFVHYEERASALKAVEVCEEAKPELDGKALSVRRLGGWGGGWAVGRLVWWLVGWGGCLLGQGGRGARGAPSPSWTRKSHDPECWSEL